MSRVLRTTVVQDQDPRRIYAVNVNNIVFATKVEHDGTTVLKLSSGDDIQVTEPFDNVVALLEQRD